ncbi:hypothetical protein RQP46_009906 [Phenoliferia psychrophenolica]
MLGSGSKKERLGRDAMKNFNCCSLCLDRARDPRVCTDGHVFCQECVLNSLLSQKRDIKRQSLLLDRMRATEEQERVLARAAARERVLKEFESAQSGLGSKATVGKTVASTVVVPGAEGRGTKRKFDLDQDEIERLAKEGEQEALERTAVEQAEARRAKLPNFWLPSLTPSATPAAMSEIKLQTLCHAAKPAHPISLKTLTSAKFEEDNSSSEPVGERPCICPICRKGLSNNVKTFVLKACGHVVCVMCVDTLCKPDKACSHCGTAFPAKGAPLIELKREGTGFASGGQAEATRFDLSFQG